MGTQRANLKFCGRQFTGEELSLIREVVQTCAGLSREELANTVCELLQWKRASGRGRLDRKHQRHGADVKTVLVYLLARNARRRLAGE